MRQKGTTTTTKWMGRNAYFLEISTGKLLLLEYTESFTISPINPDAASFDAIFVTPSAKKERVSIKREKVSIKKERTSVIKNEPDMMDRGETDISTDLLVDSLWGREQEIKWVASLKW